MGNPDTSVLSADRPRVEGSPWWSLLWAAIGAGVGAFMAPLEPSFLEEGLMLHIAERLVGGEHLYRDVHMRPGMVAPYQIELDEKEPDGSPHLIWAPFDDDRVIREMVHAARR